MTNLEELITIYAFRYCLGRMTYAVDDCIRYINTIWNDLHFKSQLVILRDLIDGIEETRCGTTYDCDKWKALAILCFFKLSDDKKEAVISSTKHKDYPAWLIPLTE